MRALPHPRGCGVIAPGDAGHVRTLRRPVAHTVEEPHSGGRKLDAYRDRPRQCGVEVAFEFFESIEQRVELFPSGQLHQDDGRRDHHDRHHLRELHGRFSPDMGEHPDGDDEPGRDEDQLLGVVVGKQDEQDREEETPQRDEEGNGHRILDEVASGGRPAPLLLVVDDTQPGFGHCFPGEGRDNRDYRQGDGECQDVAERPIHLLNPRGPEPGRRRRRSGRRCFASRSAWAAPRERGRHVPARQLDR